MLWNVQGKKLVSVMTYVIAINIFTTLKEVLVVGIFSL